MSENIHQVFVANPITSNASTDLMYFGQSPYGATNDAAMTFANFKAQLMTTGNWTPTLTGSSANPGSITYSFQAGEYSHIGNVLYYYARIIVSALTIGSASGQLQIAGLPIAAANNVAYDPVGSALVQNCTIDADTLYIVSRVVHGTTLVNLEENLNSSGAAVTMAITNISSTSDITVTGFYFTS